MAKLLDRQTRAWIELNRLSATITEVLYLSPAAAQNLASNRHYSGLLDHFNLMFDQWHDKIFQDGGTWEFSDLFRMNLPVSHLTCMADVTTRFSDLLVIEYYRIRVHTNALGIRAPIERLTANKRHGADHPILQQPLLRGRESVYIQEVMVGACAMLSKVTELADLGVLRFCPVRTFLCVVSTSMLLLATVHLGCATVEDEGVFELMDRATSGLRSCVVDDLHLSSRIGTLLEIHVRKLRLKRSRKLRTDAASGHVDTLNNSQVDTAYVAGEEPHAMDDHQQSLDPDFALSDVNFDFPQELSDDIWGFQMPTPFAPLHHNTARESEGPHFNQSL